MMVLAGWRRESIRYESHTSGCGQVREVKEEKHHRCEGLSLSLSFEVRCRQEARGVEKRGEKKGMRHEDRKLVSRDVE